MIGATNKEVCSMFRKILTITALALLGANSVSAGEILDKIKSSGKIVVATEAAFKPFEYVEDGRTVGRTSMYNRALSGNPYP